MARRVGRRRREGDFNLGWKYVWGADLTTTQSDALGPLDFPVLLLTERDSAKTLRKLLKQYKVPQMYGKDIDLHELVTERWDSDYEYGVAAPASAARKQYRKVAFVDVDRMIEDAGAEPWYYLGNVILHEMIHCAGLPWHVSDGVMRSTPPTDAKTELLQMGDSVKYPLIGNLKALAKLP